MQFTITEPVFEYLRRVVANMFCGGDDDDNNQLLGELKDEQWEELSPEEKETANQLVTAILGRWL